MRRMGLVALGVAAVVGRAAADDIYRWTDKAGGVHISNAPSIGDRKTTVAAQSMPSAPAEPPGTPGSPAAAGSGEENGSFSTDVSLRRSALERALRATEGRRRQIDAQLTALARARTQYAHGTAATGGVGTNAADARSPEELALEMERDKLTKHAAETRASSEALRDEVTQRFGATPAWWRDLR